MTVDNVAYIQVLPLILDELHHVGYGCKWAILNILTI